MKYFDKDKTIRQKYWFTVEVVPKSTSTFDWKAWDTWAPGPTKRDMADWCNQQASDGKYYFYYGVNTWWFQRQEDATLFALRWA